MGRRASPREGEKEMTRRNDEGGAGEWGDGDRKQAKCAEREGTDGVKRKMWRSSRKGAKGEKSRIS